MVYVIIGMLVGLGIFDIWISSRSNERERAYRQYLENEYKNDLWRWRK